jgi:hypothetical protein
MSGELRALFVGRPLPVWLWIALVGSGCGAGAAISWLLTEYTIPGIIIGGLIGIAVFIAIKVNRMAPHA